MPKPLVDIIIPVYNRKELLKRAVRSVQNQSYKNWNLLIVDDGSREDLAPRPGFWLKGSGAGPEKERIKILRLEQNKGPSYARNFAIKRGKADWIAFLDSDDEWAPQKLSRQMEYARKNPHCPWIHCNEIWLRKGKVLSQKKKHKKSGGRIFIPSVRLCCVSPSAALVKALLFKELGLFREDFPVCEDYEMWLRISSRYPAGFLDQALTIKHGGHEDQLSKKYFAMDYWRAKALLPYLEDKNLSLEERREVRQTLIKKTNILLKGYKKHKRLKQKKEIEALRAQLA